MPHYIIIEVPIHYENTIKKMKEQQHHIHLPKLWKIATEKALIAQVVSQQRNTSFRTKQALGVTISLWLSMHYIPVKLNRTSLHGSSIALLLGTILLNCFL